jgi:hypothetical protein
MTWPSNFPPTLRRAAGAEPTRVPTSVLAWSGHTTPQLHRLRARDMCIFQTSRKYLSFYGNAKLGLLNANISTYLNTQYRQVSHQDYESSKLVRTTSPKLSDWDRTAGYWEMVAGIQKVYSCDFEPQGEIKVACIHIFLYICIDVCFFLATGWMVKHTARSTETSDLSILTKQAATRLSSENKAIFRRP